MASDAFTVKVCSLEELAKAKVRVVAAEGRTVCVVSDGGRVHAVDNRCPHMGFPLSRGTVKDGILTCHWHHAKFDLASGCTFDPFADDVPRFEVAVRDGWVWLDPHPRQGDPLRRWLAKLDEGLEQRIPLVLAKSVIGLDELGGTIDVIESTALFGIRNRAAGWSSGLSILTALANLLPTLDAEDRRRALFHGLVRVQASTADEPPSFDLRPLATADATPERFVLWFRRFVDVRASEAAERTLRTAIAAGMPQAVVAEMVFSACTDHLFLGEGHALDFANKAFELLDHVGWKHAGDVLTSLIPVMVDARRMEETSTWRHPVNLPALLEPAFAALDDAIAQGGGRLGAWDGHRGLAEQILDGEPAATIEAIVGLVREGVPAPELSASVAYAASRRAAHFPTTNEIPDWETVHHTFTYANAVDQAMRRAPVPALLRGVLDGAMAVYLDRFLNVPKRPLPEPRDAAPTTEEFLAVFDRQGNVDAAGEAAAALCTAGRHDELVRLLGHVLLREDSTFHEFQILEASVRQYRTFAGRPEGDHVLLGAARFLAAHFPTVRTLRQTFDIAARLHRGEAPYEEID